MELTPKLLAGMLAQQAEQIARHLLPQGKRDGSEWRAGSTGGEPGQSLGVHLSGDKAGIWRDFALDEGGDLLDLWVATQDVTLAQAMTEAKNFLGITESKPSEPAKSFRKPVTPKCTKPKDAELQWLTDTRKLHTDAIEAYQIATSPGKIIFPFKDANNKLRMVKTRDTSDGTCKPTSKEQRPTLFGWQAIPPDTRSVAICEGELDAPSLWTYGVPALSVPFGGGTGAKQQWIEHEYEDLLRFDEIYLVMDHDSTGKKGVEAIVERLGRERCRVVTLPRKDANDCLKDDVPIGEIHRAFESAPYLDPAELRRASSFADEVLWTLHPDRAPAGSQGILPPWEKNHGTLEFRMADLALMAGINGHGKSQLAGFLTLHAAMQGARGCIASMEMPSRRLLANLVKQGTGTNDPTDGYVHHTLQWLDDRVLNYSKKGRVTPKELMEVFRYARKRHGCNWFVVDSLMMVGIDEDDYNSQKDFVEELAEFKNAENVFVLLLAHARKGDNEERPPGKMDIKGTGAITDLVDTVMVAWRNKPKEWKLEAHHKGAKVLEDDDLDDLLQRPDALLNVHKQRNHPEGKEPNIGLWFDPVTLQYLPSPGAQSKRYIDYSGEPEQAHAQA